LPSREWLSLGAERALSRGGGRASAATRGFAARSQVTENRNTGT